MPVEATEKIPDRARADVVAGRVTLGLDINLIQTERVLINYAINSVVTAAAERSACISSRSAEPYTQKQIDYKVLKEIRRRCLNSI